MGNKHRPFYRVVVAKSTAARDGSFIEQLGLYNPVAQPKVVEIDGERALHWLRVGAQPTETVAVLLKKQGVLDKFFEERPNAARDYSFLDKTTSAMSKPSPVDEGRAQASEPAQTEAPAEAPATEPVAEPAAEPAAEETPAEVQAEAPAEESAQSEAEAAPAEEAPAAEPQVQEEATAEPTEAAAEETAPEPTEDQETKPEGS